MKITLEIIRYLSASGFAFLIDFTFLYALVELANFHYLLASSCSFLLGTCTHYVISTAWVFKVRRMVNKFKEFAFFSFIGGFGLGFNGIIMMLFIEIINLNYLHAKLLATLISFVFNYSLRKWFLFNSYAA